MRKINVGILGIGNIGCAYTGYILKGKCPELEISATCDNNPQRLQRATKQGYGFGSTN